jgi:uncharacterized protein
LATKPKNRTQKVRDPVHGLIVFEESNKLDQLAWKLINTVAFQRLRRIRQLGVSEFVFPGATHTRFAHSVGVFQNARRLVEIIDREMKREKQKPKAKRAEVVVIGALLHDLGHGPFSHTFEGVQKSRGIKKDHEEWTQEIIRNPNGHIKPLLDAYWPNGKFCEEIAALWDTEEPTDIYHAIVSSSFDADRLDYLRRDRLMTGTGAGAIDFDWLMEHVRVGEVLVGAPDEDDDEDGDRVQTFCLDIKARAAAEQFLLSRYTLHEQVYFHKTTRCIEKMIARLFRTLALEAEKPTSVERNTGLSKDHALIRFFGNRPDKVKVGPKKIRKEKELLASYLQLDDALVWGAMERMQQAKSTVIATLAKRLLSRDLYKALDVAYFGEDKGTQSKHKKRISKEFATKIASESVILDEDASISIYTEVGGDDEKTHKKLHVLDVKKPKEITKLSELVAKLKEKSTFVRFYFENESDRDAARDTGRGK